MLQTWTAELGAIARSSLTLCPEFPLIARRFEAWWRQEVVDRPLWLGAANKNPARPITRRIDLIHDPERWLEAKLEDLAHRQFFGDAIPNIRVDFGAACLGSLLGVPVEFSSDTTWTHACIKNEDWSDAPVFQLQGRWWKQMQLLLDVAASEAKGRFAVCTPSLGGLGDVLTNLRGATEICMDVLEQPARILSVMDQLFPLWKQGFAEIYQRIVGAGAALIHWHLLWSDLPYVVTECDLGFSISQSDFEKVCLPDISRTAAAVGRSVFHLDGAGSTRHVDALLEVPEIRAIQYTPGAASPSAMPWLEMFRKVQSKGRSLLVFAPLNEVISLFDELSPEGLAVLVEGPATLAELQAVDAEIKRRFGEA
jgi:hypothetical protein